MLLVVVRVEDAPGKRPTKPVFVFSLPVARAPCSVPGADCKLIRARSDKDKG